MDIVIKQIASNEDVSAMLEVWQQVFEREMGIVLPRESALGNISHWLARTEQGREPVGTLSVVDTTDQHQLHESLGLTFAPQAHVARFTHLAVLKPYRGKNIPLALMLEAHRRVIIPGQFDHTWLLFDVERAANSFLSRQLGFTVLPQTFVSRIRLPMSAGATRAHARSRTRPSQGPVMFEEARVFLRATSWSVLNSLALVPGNRRSQNTLHHTEYTTQHHLLGLTSWYSVRAGEKNAPRGAWQHIDLPAYARELNARVASPGPPWMPFTKKTNESWAMRGRQLSPHRHPSVIP